MNRQDFIKAVAQKTGDSQKRTKEILEAMQEVVFAEMKAEGEVKVFEGVTLMGVHKDARTARNPLDGSTVSVPEKTMPKVKFGKTVKDYLIA